MSCSQLTKHCWHGFLPRQCTLLYETQSNTHVLCSVDQRGAYVDMGGKQPLFCPVNEASVCKLQKVGSASMHLVSDAMCCSACGVVHGLHHIPCCSGKYLNAKATNSPADEEGLEQRGLWWVLLIQATQVFQVDQQREFIVNHVDRKNGRAAAVRQGACPFTCMHACCQAGRKLAAWNTAAEFCILRSSIGHAGRPLKRGDLRHCRLGCADISASGLCVCMCERDLHAFGLRSPTLKSPLCTCPCGADAGAAAGVAAAAPGVRGGRDGRGGRGVHAPGGAHREGRQLRLRLCARQPRAGGAHACCFARFDPTGGSVGGNGRCYKQMGCPVPQSS